MADLIQFRSDTLAHWTDANPILAKGSLALIEDTGGYRVGDGVLRFLELPAQTLSAEALALTLQARSEVPAAPPAAKLLMFSQAIAGRILPKFIGPSGLDSALQPFLARNKVGYWNPPGNAATAPGVFGYTPITFVGTAVTRNVATTNLFTRMRRYGNQAAAATAGTVASARVAVAQVTVGDGNLGGFFKVVRFGISDPGAIPTDARMFVGIRNVTTAPTNVEPSTLNQSVGVGHGAADTNLKLFYGGSVAQPPIDLGPNFPINTSSVDAYELALFAPPGGDLTWQVTRLNTGDTAVGLITDNTLGVKLPLYSTLLSYMHMWRCNNTTAVLTAFDLMSDYIETDN